MTARLSPSESPMPDGLALDGVTVTETAAADAAVTVRRRRRPKVLVALAATWLGVVLLLAVTAPWLPIEPYGVPIGQRNVGPGFRWPEPLGTDELGRSMTSRIIWGARASLTVGVFAILLPVVLGGTLGMIAGYRKRWVDASIGFIVSVGLAFPPLILLLALTAVLTPSMTSLIIALSVVFTPTMVRVARAATLRVSAREFVTASRALGASHRRVVLRDILPNILSPLSTVAFVSLATVMVAEGSLSFLGLGLRPPRPSWGGMIASGRAKLATEPYLVFLPAFVLIVTVISIQFVGDWARKRYDRRESQLG